MSVVIEELQRRLVEHLSFIYPDIDQPVLAERLISAMGVQEDCESPLPHRNLWDERDAVLITYGHSITKEGEMPLVTLHQFLTRYLQGIISTVHVLPFFPYSSDDGFSVIDYLKVNEELGSWKDIRELASEYRLMADLVVNHMSSKGQWFENFKKRTDPGKDYFVEASPDDDLHDVVRPRSSELLTQVETEDGIRYVWCTFSADQVDLNFRNPEVLLEFINIIRFYLEHGITIFRLDAVAYVWKELGTPCIHLQQTHEIIKLLRTLIGYYTPDAMLITETNVPNRENLTYFGNTNEAHAIYNFSLPPLLLYTLISGDCRHLKTWMMSMPPARLGTCYLNFIASHDGIGLRPLEGLLSDEERENLIAVMEGFGGRITTRKTSEGEDRAYELNISLFDALRGSIENGEDEWHIERYIAAHAIMLALEGIPAFYIHSLLGTENDQQRVAETGRNRSINRHVWRQEELEEALSDPERHHGEVFRRLSRLMEIRRRQAGFHPNATQYTLHLGTCVFAFWRQSISRDQSIFCLNNVTDSEQCINMADINLIPTDAWIDLISGDSYSELDEQIVLSPYQSIWLSNKTD